MVAGMRRTRFLAIGAAIAIGVCLPGAALADNPATGSIFVAEDHVLPGGTMTVLGAGLEPGTALELRLSAGTTSAGLGLTIVAADGSVTVKSTVPAGFPPGYAEMAAIDSAGRTWSSTVLIGPRAEGPAAIDGAGRLGDGAVIGLSMVGLGLLVLVIVGLRYLRGRPR